MVWWQVLTGAHTDCSRVLCQVLADYDQNLNRSVSPGDPKLWPYYMQWGPGFPAFHGQAHVTTCGADK